MQKYIYIIGLFLLVSCASEEDSMTKNINEEMIDDGITQTIDNLYASIEYDGNQPPNWQMMRSCFVDTAYLMDVADTTHIRYTIEEYIDLYRSDIEAGNYRYVTEYELANVGDVYANIAQVFSSYAATIIPTEGDTLKKRGINSIQLLNDNGSWKITSIIWYDETEEYPIPEEYLKEQKEE